VTGRTLQVTVSYGFEGIRRDATASVVVPKILYKSVKGYYFDENGEVKEVSSSQNVYIVPVTGTFADRFQIPFDLQTAPLLYVSAVMVVKGASVLVNYSYPIGYDAIPSTFYLGTNRGFATASLYGNGTLVVSEAYPLTVYKFIAYSENGTPLCERVVTDVFTQRAPRTVSCHVGVRRVKLTVIGTGGVVRSVDLVAQEQSSFLMDALMVLVVAVIAIVFVVAVARLVAGRRTGEQESEKKGAPASEVFGEGGETGLDRMLVHLGAVAGKLKLSLPKKEEGEEAEEAGGEEPSGEEGPSTGEGVDVG